MFLIRRLLQARRASAAQLLPVEAQKGVFLKVLRLFWVLLRVFKCANSGSKRTEINQFGGAKSSQLGKFSVNLLYLLRNPG